MVEVKIKRPKIKNSTKKYSHIVIYILKIIIVSNTTRTSIINMTHLLDTTPHLLWSPKDHHLPHLLAPDPTARVKHGVVSHIQTRCTNILTHTNKHAKHKMAGPNTEGQFFHIICFTANLLRQCDCCWGSNFLMKWFIIFPRPFHSFCIFYWI